MSVSLVARQHGISGSQIFTWRRLVAQGALTAAGAGEEVVPASEYRALQNQVAELQRVLGKETMEAEILREAVFRAAGPKNSYCARSRCQGTTGERGGRGIGHQPRAPVSHAQPITCAPARPTAFAGCRTGRRHSALIADLPTYGYRRVHALLRRQTARTGRTAPNPKRVYRVMKVHGIHPHKALGYLSPREYITQTREASSGI